MTHGIESFELSLSRSAFSPRDAARAGDIWRMLQDAAVQGSNRRGWDPRRYREAGVAFVVRAMRVLHHREVAFGEPLDVSTWVTTFRRDMFTDRQIRVRAGGRPLIAATQEWVHVQTSPEVRVARASPELRDSFVIVAHDPDVELPASSPATGPSWELAFETWFTWMDPLGHANHPAYVDWCDEALARRVAERGGRPLALAPIAEEVRFKSGVVAPERVRVITTPSGLTAGGAVVCEHEILGGDGRVCATATTVRVLVDDDLAARLAVAPRSSHPLGGPEGARA